MSLNSFVILSVTVFLPAAGALLIAFLPKQREEMIKLFSLLVTVATFALTLAMVVPLPWGALLEDAPGGAAWTTWYDVHASQMQHAFSVPWISRFNVHYFLGIDGISLPLVLLTSFLSMLAMGASWTIGKHVKAYCILFLLLETGMLGVFLALDFFLFYVFWEVMLLPMYFLIGVWGGPRREYAAIKFFLFTLVGSVLMLVAILMLYFSSDLGKLSRSELRASHAEESLEIRPAAAGQQAPQHTFNLLALSRLGQIADSPFDRPILWGKSIQWWAFLLLLFGFLIKVPSVPVHTWLPDAHVEAPTPISMILAGVLLKMGGYGILRICYPICPDAAYELAWLVVALGVVSMVYGAFAALAQKDFKRLVAYSSVSHMGYVVLGIGAWTLAAGNPVSGDYWKMGINGAMFQMIAHGLSSAGMFFLVGVIYDRVHHRNLDEFGGLFNRMPVYGGLAMGIFFAALGLPGLCGFIGEVFVVLASWNYSQALGVVAASVVILTAGYILWTIQRVYLGAEYRGPHAENITPITPREVAIAAPLLALAILFGVYPNALFRYMTPTINRGVDQMATWMRVVKEPRLRETPTESTLSGPHASAPNVSGTLRVPPVSNVSAPNVFGTLRVPSASDASSPPSVPASADPPRTAPATQVAREEGGRP